MQPPVKIMIFSGNWPGTQQLGSAATRSLDNLWPGWKLEEHVELWPEETAD